MAKTNYMLYRDLVVVAPGPVPDDVYGRVKDAVDQAIVGLHQTLAEIDPQLRLRVQ